MANDFQRRKRFREIFDELTVGLVDFLEDHVAVHDVKLLERAGVTPEKICEWEKKNSPFQLPEDYKHFMMLSEGVLVKWSVDFKGKVVPLGCIHLNALNSLKPLDDDDLEEFQKNINGQKEAGETTDETEILSPSCSNLPRAFEIDNACQNGRVVLMYLNNYTNPQVWFQDLGCDWNYVADSFENYFRLVILHMGILHWLYAFTEVGLDPITQQWMRYFSPYRLEVDEQKTEKQTKTRKSKKNKKVNLAKIDRIVRKHGTKAKNVISKLNSKRPGTAL